MNRNLSIISVVILTLLLSSCEKTWQCECISYTNPPPGPLVVTGSFTVTLKGEKKEMNGSCEAYARARSASTTGIGCKMK